MLHSRILPGGRIGGRNGVLTAVGCRRVRGAPSPRGRWSSRRRCACGLSAILSSAAGVPAAGAAVALAAMILVVLGALGAGAVRAITGHAATSSSSASASASARGPGPGPRSAAALGASAATRDEAATWIAGQVAASAIVACDPAMCAALQADGLPATRLLVLGTATADPLGSDVVVATPAVRNQFGTRLQSVYAPVVIASFGTGAGRIDIRAIAPDGTAAYQAAARRGPPQPDLRGRSAAPQSAHRRRRRRQEGAERRRRRPAAAHDAGRARRTAAGAGQRLRRPVTRGEPGRPAPQRPARPAGIRCQGRGQPAVHAVVR